ncbi:MAG: hypothetical protein JOY69_05490 [Candidatus Eremiobacteraeota bacterium]|nr:hypothetical protein [Candidatus Eremiobacteraeota bacterium]
MLAMTLSVPVSAQEPANAVFSPSPPGTVVQSQLGYLTGEAMHSQWRGVVSKKLVGRGNGTDFYQWYLSMYAIDNGTYRLKYQSPANGGPLEKVTQASGGAKMWYPIQELRIAGVGQFTEAGVQQFVVQSHQAGADCGGAVVSVFGANANGSVVPNVAVRNGCELKATISHSNSSAVRDAIVLSGPYYNSTAPLCCPTKSRAAAVLRYRNGKWIETPNYFELFAGKLPPA